MKDLCDLCTFNCPTSGCAKLSHESCLKEVIQLIKPSVTNGEVIKALFPNADYCGGAHFMHITNVNSIGEVSFPWEWWNASYKAESEEIRISDVDSEGPLMPL